MPPYLAGREAEIKEFRRLLGQDVILENMVLTGLRGVGKTVLLERFRPMTIQEGWLWVGADLSESTSISEENIATRLLTDLAVATSSLVVATEDLRQIGFTREESRVDHTLSFQMLSSVYSRTPGLVLDKLKAVLELVWAALSTHNRRGIIFAYDEAQNLSDHSGKDQFPLSLLLDLFQSIQRKEIRFMLALTGLPTLFPKLVEARTFAERMCRVVFLKRLDEHDSREAILRPIQSVRCPVTFTDQSVNTIINMSGGYPYFIQFICREVFDVFIQQMGEDRPGSVPALEIIQKMDTDFFAGRWARATDRQRELLMVIAKLENSESEFTVQEVVEKSKQLLKKPFSSSHTNQMLASLSDAGLVYKNRHGKYSFAVPLLGQFIARQTT